MPEYRKVTASIDVPKGTGVAGCIELVRGILSKSRVQEVIIKAGNISYSRFIREGEHEDPLQIDLSTLMPYHVIRNAELEELVCSADDAPVMVLGMLFSITSTERLNPIAFACSPVLGLNDWLKKGENFLEVKNGELFGLPVLLDQNIPDDALILCTGYQRRGELIDTVKSFKVAIRNADL